MFLALVPVEFFRFAGMTSGSLLPAVQFLPAGAFQHRRPVSSALSVFLPASLAPRGAGF